MYLDKIPSLAARTSKQKYTKVKVSGCHHFETFDWTNLKNQLDLHADNTKTQRLKVKDWVPF